MEEDVIKIKQLLQSLNSNYNQVTLNDKDVKWLLRHMEHCLFESKTTESYWKLYKIYFSRKSRIHVEFQYLNRPPDYPNSYSPDYSFREELLAMSKLTDKEIFYLWSQHADEGYEVYKAGQCINSVISETHDPCITVNGKAVEIPKKVTWYGEKHEVGKVIDENSIIPKQIRDSTSYKKFQSESVVFIEKGIPGFESLVEKIKLA